MGAAAVAFSGGVDSTLLLHAARTALGENVVAFYAASPLQTAVEQQRAMEQAAACDSRLVRFAFDPFSWPEFVANPPGRCYLCKTRNYSRFVMALAEHGCAVLLDGTNADDLHDDRPGLRALRELGVVTPLAAAGMRKADVRNCAHAIGLSVWDAPSSSCLATRIPHGQPLGPEKIAFVGMMEKYLVGRGFLGCRVRWGAERLGIEVREQDISRLHILLDTPPLHKMAQEKGFTVISVTQRVDR